MQPLARVVKRASMSWGAEDTISSRPKVAVKIAQCVAEWADIETILGVLLGVILDTEAKAALAMYASLENRAAQRRMLMAAAEANLSTDDYDLLEAIMKASVTPAMRQRDKLAHWSWGTCKELPDDLILQPPAAKTELHYILLQSAQKRVKNVDRVFVITEKYLAELARDLREAKRRVSEFGASLWPEHSRQQRAEFRQRLLSEPLIHEAWERQKESRQKNREAHPPSPGSEQNETP
jgi:hypothetical protein